MKERLQQRGSSAVLMVLLILVLAGIGFAGWYVWSKQHKGKTADDSSPTATQNDSPKEQLRASKGDQNASAYTYPADKWNEYKNDKLGFAFHYPKGWGEMDVRFDGSNGFYLAVFNNPTEEWGRNETFERADIELRGNSIAKTQDNHGEFSKGFYRNNGKYFQVGGADGDAPIPDNKVVAYGDQGGLQTLLIKHLNLESYEVLELVVNLKDKNVLGLDLTLLHPKLDQSEGPAYSPHDTEVMKQIAASFRSL